MKLKQLFFLVFFVLLAAMADAKQAVTVTGRDWLLMTGTEKTAYITSSVDFLKKYGISPAKTREEYIAALNQYSDNPKMLSVNATNILTTYIYNTEPENRKILDTLGKKTALHSTA